MKNFDNNSNRWHQSGISSYLTVMFVAVVATFVVAVIQSRLLLGIHRNRALSDILVATYNAESEIYDIFARILEGYVTVSEVSGTKTLTDGTVLDISGSGAEGSETVLIKANRPFAVQTLEGTRTFTSEESGVDRVEIVLTVDCTHSMNSGSGIPGKNRLKVQEEALITFVNEVAALPDADKIHLGIEAFTEDAKWLQTLDGTEIRPDQNISYADIAAAIDQEFGTNNENSPACQRLLYFFGTSIGSGIDLAHEYYKTRPPEDDTTVYAEIVTTDGEPTVRRPHPECPETTHYCPGQGSHCGTYPTGTNSNAYITYGWLCKDSGSGWVHGGGNCIQPAKEFMECTLADTNTEWNNVKYPGSLGIRDPRIDLYALTVYTAPPPDVQAMFEEHAKVYLHADEADQLADKLDLILEDIISGSQFIRIRRVLPSP